ncbi:MAG TPA: SpoIIE family protein phosphatase [Victivallales bacterium]|nr:SpoIIE family protein phosphatase [Victivallales bacterium]
MQLKKIKLNTLFFTIFIILIGGSFLVLYKNSIHNYSNLKKFAHKILSKQIIDLTVENYENKIQAESDFINRQLLKSIQTSKQIGALVNSLNGYELSNKSNLRVKLKIQVINYFLNSKKRTCYFKDYYTFMENDSLSSPIGGAHYGFVAGAMTRSLTEKQEIDVNRLYVLKPLLKSIILDPNSPNRTIAIYSNKDKVFASYCDDPGNNLISFITTFKPMKNYSKEFRDKNFLIIAKRRANILNHLDISVECPLFDSDGNLEYVVSLMTSYNDFNTLYTDRNSNEINLVINENNEVVFLTTKGYGLFSIPRSSAELNTALDLSVDQPLDVKLSDSTDPAIRNLTNVFDSNKKGTGKKFLEINGNQYLMLYRNIPASNWKVAYFIKTSILYRSFYLINSTFESIYKSLYSNYIFSFLIIGLISFLIIYLLLKFIFIKPIKALKVQSREIGKGRFNYKVKETGVNEIYELSRTFNNLVSRLDEYTNNLKKEVSARQAVETELKIAGDLQNSVLPKITDEFIKDEFELYAKLIPAKDMSGDFYDIFYAGKDTLTIVLADVSGKGLPAAFYMSMSKAIIKDACFSADKLDPAEILTKVNETLSKDNDACMFLTMYLFFYNYKTGKLTYSNAGHHEFVTIDNNGVTKTEGILKSMAIGIFEGAPYTNNEIQLSENQIFAVYTDGIIEAPDKDEEEYDTERVLKLFSENYNKKLNDLGDLLIKDVLDFQSGNKFDDITLVMLKRTIDH